MAKLKNAIRGDSHTINLAITNGGTAVNLTGYTVFFTVNASEAPADDTSAVIQKTVTSHSAPTLGQTIISLAPADTSSLTPGTFWYDIQLKDPSGNVTSFDKDKFILVSDITRRTT